ncbi:DUF2975 domain-containing protein [Flavisolibacter sp. BT320]|nr:DUF2975 domain-containing protein [Flavisolibacter longurius]
MEIKITTNQTLKILQVLSWIIFIGLCVEAGAITVSTIITLFINPQGVKNFWEGSEYLSSLHSFDVGHFFAITTMMIIVSVLKAILFYQIIKIFTKIKLDLSRPFSLALSEVILLLAYLALGIGFFSSFGYNYSTWLTTDHGIAKADLEALHISGSDVWFFMAVILFVIVQIVKKGTEIQTENDLTV